jgi:peptidoglycan/LPS O-acetylase OafA/YrhL
MNAVAKPMTPDSVPRFEKRASLQSLQAGRAIAALLVTAFHLTFLFTMAPDLSRGSFKSLTWWGFRGVDFFFVLSGFIIFFAHEKDIGQIDKLRRYIAKRFSRVYPVYWLYTGFFVMLSSLGSGVVLVPLKNLSTFISSVLLVRFSPIDPPITVAWTLFHEVTFYVVFATLIANRRVGTLIFAGWLLGITALHIWPTPHTIFGTVFSIFNLNFFFGMLAFVVHRWARPFPAAILVVLGIAGGVISLVADAKLGGSIAVQVGFAATFASIIAGCAALERNGREWRVWALVFLGDASYSIYLVHTFVEIYLLKAMRRLPFFPDLPAWAVYLAVFALTVATGLFAHVVAEKPLTRLFRRRFTV